MTARKRKYVQTGDPDAAAPLTKEDREHQRIAESAHAAAAATLKRLPRVKPSDEQIVGLRAIFSNASPPSQLMRWRLRLFCGHVTERTCNVDRLDGRSAFLSEACEECGLDPAVVVAAKPLGLESDLPAAEVNQSAHHDHREEVMSEIERLETRLSRLRGSLDEPPRKAT